MKYFENYYPTATPVEAVSREEFLANVREIAKEDPTREISIVHGRDESGQDCFAIVSASLGADIGYGEKAVTDAENFDSWWDAEWDDTVTEYEDNNLDDVVIAISFAGRDAEVVSRLDYIKRFLGLDPYRASEYEIENAEDAGDFMACESVRKAYNAMSRWDFDLRISFVKDIMDGENTYTAEAEEVYFDLRALWVDQIIAGVEGKLNPEVNETGLPYDEWCERYAACACDEVVDDFSEVDIPARHAKDGKAFTIWFKAPEELE